jgi:hypothetical protein
MPALLLLLLVAAPDGKAKTYEIAYRFGKGVKYTDRSSRVFKLDMYGGKKLAQFHVESEQVIRRTVIEVDDGGRPSLERVEVLVNSHTTKMSPNEEELGVTLLPSHGKSFVWRRYDGKKWGLFDDKGEVTAKHPQLVQKLRNWRDARLPGKPVAVGATWEVAAGDFLEAVGQPVPPGVKGRAVFKLEAVEDGVARITFTFKETYPQDGVAVVAEETGTWRFDVKRGRDLSVEARGILEIDKGDAGSGKFGVKREVTYEGDSPAPKPRDS